MQIIAGTTQLPADPHVFLIGRPPMGEYLGYLKTQTLEGQSADAGELAEQWRSAHARVQQLAKIDSGAADDPPNQELPTSLSASAATVMSDPMIIESFGITRNEIKLVNLDRLVVFQKQINLTYAAELGAALGDDPSEKDLLAFALPTDGRYDPTPNAAPIGFGPLGAQVWAMISPSTDYRVLQTALVDPSQITGVRFNGRPKHVVIVPVGYGPNLLSALRVGSRLILKNGSHRAYALRAAGHTYAPMLIQNIPGGEEAEHLPPEVQQQADLYLTSPRPPLLRDYFDDDLHLVVHVPRKTKQIRVAVNYEEGPAPGA